MKETTLAIEKERESYRTRTSEATETTEPE
jgi:hypothetical protein